MVGRRVGVHGLWFAAALMTCAQASDSGAPLMRKRPGLPATANRAQESARDPTTAPRATLMMPELGVAIESAIAAHKLPGAVVAVGRAAGLLGLQAYGARAVQPEHEVMTPDTIFDLASLTKPVVTATLVMQLVDAGRIDLDAPLGTYLPELATRSPISVRQLLLHTSGLPHVDRLRDYDAQPTSALARILLLPLVTVPGKTFSYSDLGYIVLGQLIEHVSGEALAVRAATQLFGPLRMVDSGFRPEPPRWPRIAPTERIDPRRAPLVSAAARAYGVIRGEVHDPRAFRLGGVAGNAGAFSTAADLARYARMLLNGGTLDGARILSERSVEQMTAAQRIGDTVRTLGWDMHSRYSGLRGGHLSERAFGHGGFTGTSLWIDPGQDLFIVFLSNRVHPDGRGYVIPLVGQITDALVAQLQAATTVPAPSSPQPLAADIALPCNAPAREVRTGIDVLRASDFAALGGRNVGLVVNNASRARDGTPTSELFRKQRNLQLRAVFAPEHGLASGSEGVIANGSWHDLPVYSLFGKTRRPTPEMLRGIDTIVFDLADVGTRFFTYMSTLRQILEATAHSSIEVVVLDRPNPIGAASIEGPVLSADLHSFVNYHTLPVRHGMTTGELAELIVGERHIAAKLSVVSMQGYSRKLLFEQTGLPWFAPSPNLPSVRSAVLYPALGLLESTNLSVGRGTDHPFEFVGAPWLDATRLAGALAQTGLPGVRFEAVDVTPRSDRYAGQLCHGVRLHLEDPRVFLAVRTGLAIAHQLRAQQPRDWETRDLGKLVGDPAVVSALLQGAAVSELERLWQPALTRFAAVRKHYLRYPECPTPTSP
jgi:uncharacterized protein YbbC (DUF1343 family)/CubicO group peptidase (beta-lactamase class C family)